MFSSSASWAEASVAKDLEDEPDNDPEIRVEDDISDDESDSDLETLRQITSGPSLGRSMLCSSRDEVQTRTAGSHKGRCGDCAPNDLFGFRNVAQHSDTT